MLSGEYPVFPLRTLLFPGCRLPLQIFEQRYLGMVRDCLKQDKGFVIVLIQEGAEVGAPASIYEVGTYCNIVDWTSLPNGLLGITVEGRERVRIGATAVKPDNLRVAELAVLEEPEVPDSTQVAVFADLLKQLEEHPLNSKLGTLIDYASPIRVVWALCQLLPFDNQQKQKLLEADDPEVCLDEMDAMLRELEG